MLRKHQRGGAGKRPGPRLVSPWLPGAGGKGALPLWAYVFFLLQTFVKFPGLIRDGSLLAKVQTSCLACLAPAPCHQMATAPKNQTEDAEEEDG